MKIEKWHNKNMKNKGHIFIKDEDFVELDRSPTNFDSSSCDESFERTPSP